MKSSAEVEAEFRAKMQALIAEYKATIEIEDVSNSYLSENVIGVFIPTVWDGDKIVSDSASFNFGDSI